ncbi:fungal-specific transcription factor domain-domain-containing protein [Leucosporidium creatinivorum]|uniref:Fungal-specific transcription factor domain-domain-containing protein n=1 Tax=Leucosporidium creatinivorum TaxID=106004 RepID=A0A1Y2FRS8_9BASI|nr:fungal-specific transcription factor domain-domain-containing protein [Leucosporidium creatinivorum]
MEDAQAQVQAPGAAPPAPAPAKKSRSRSGCLTCRKYHKRCCETKPTCERCSRLGHECSWPEPAQPRRRAATTSAPPREAAPPPALPVEVAPFPPASSSSGASTGDPAPSSSGGSPNGFDFLGDVAPIAGLPTPSTSALPLPPPPPMQAFDLLMLDMPAGELGTWTDSGLVLPDFSTPAPDASSYDPGDWQESMDKLIQDLMTTENDGALGQGAIPSLEGLSNGLAAPVEPTPIQNALSEFFRHCDELRRAAASRTGTTEGKDDPLPQIYNCKNGSHVLELLPTAFIWLNAYKIGNELPLLGGYAKYMDGFFQEQHEVVCSAALISGAAFLAVQRFDDECSIELRQSTGEAFLSATGIELVDLADAAASINRQLGPIREKTYPAWEAFLDDPSVNLIGKISACYDIAMTEYLLDGAAQCAKRLDRITSLVQAVSGSQATLHLTDLTGFEHQAVGKWLGADCFSSILRNRRTTFIYTCDAPTHEKYNNPSTVVGVEWLFACPDIIFVAMASTSNLAADIREDSAAFIAGQLAPHYSARRDHIFSTLHNYTPRLTPCLRGSSFYNVTRIAAQEVWRQAALIHFHQVLAGLPAEHPTLQDCLKSLLSVYAIVEQGLPALLCGPMTVPMFLASTIAVTPQDQNRLRRRHEALHVYVGPRDCHRFVEKLWRKRFEGEQLDWHVLAETEKPLSYI